MAIAVILMLVSAFTYALAFVLQHKGTQDAIGDGAEQQGARQLVKSRVWLVGVILLTPAFILHVAALSFGSVAVVQPLIVTELIFIPPLAAVISKASISKRDWLAIVGVTLGLGGFLLIAQPTEGDPGATSTAAWVGATLACFVLMGIFYAVGSRQNVVFKAALFGFSAGLVNTLLALYAAGATASTSAGAIATNPLTYLTIIAALGTISANAIAFRSGPITASTPAMISINPIASVVISIIIFGVAINSSVWAILGIVICIAVVGYGILTLTQSDTVHGAIEAEAEFDEEVSEATHLAHQPEKSTGEV